MATQMNGFSTIICGHRGGGGDPRNRDILTQSADWSALDHEPDHYDYRDQWANRLPTFARMLEQGVRCFEHDLLPSSDGDVMMVHNSVINGKNVWECSTEELETQGCARFEDLLDMVEDFQKLTGEKVTLLNELKGSSPPRRRPTRARTASWSKAPTWCARWSRRFRSAPARNIAGTMTNSPSSASTTAC